MFAKIFWIRERPERCYATGILGAALGFGMRLAIGPHLQGAPFITFIPTIVLVAFLGGIGPGFLTLGLSGALVYRFFLPAAGFGPLWPDNWVALSAFGIVSGIMVVLVDLAVMNGLRFSRATEALRQANETLETRIAERTAELMAAEESLRQAQKMEAIGQLTGGIAHDFNNLLTGLGGSLELLKARLSQGRWQESERYINAAQEATSRAARLTHRLLAFSRQQPLEPRPKNLNSLVNGMSELIRRTIGPGITLRVSSTPRLWTVLADPHQLEHALLNLCINASDAMPEGGRLNIVSGNALLDEAEAKPLGIAPGAYVTLSVSDTGRGMAPEVMARAFDPFFTTKPIGQGTGLGLSMIYGFARQSGGHAAIRSAPGAGTTVTLFLPRHEGAADETLPPAAAPVILPAAGETVLVVDDEASVRTLIAEILNDHGYTILEAQNGQEALDVLRRLDVIDLMIADLGLPGGMSGSELAAAARRQRRHLKILFITGYGTRVAADDLAPGMEWLSKPFFMAELAARVQKMLAPAQPVANLGENRASL